jgi:hypothetical protein
VQSRVVELREVSKEDAKSDVLGIGYEPWDVEVKWMPPEDCLPADDLHVLVNIPTEDLIGTGFVLGR